jgi:hypothetical protein
MNGNKLAASRYRRKSPRIVGNSRLRRVVSLPGPIVGGTCVRRGALGAELTLPKLACPTIRSGDDESQQSDRESHSQPTLYPIQIFHV